MAYRFWLLAQTVQNLSLNSLGPSSAPLAAGAAPLDVAAILVSRHARGVWKRIDGTGSLPEGEDDTIEQQVSCKAH